MATSLSNAPTLEWAGASDGTQPVVKDYAEGTSETFNKGDLVVYDASEDGVVIAAQGDGGVFGDTDDDESADNTIHLGIALKDATGTSGSLIPVLLPRPQDFFAAVVYTTDNTTIAAPVIDDIGKLVDFIRGDSNNNTAVGILRGTGGSWARVVDLNRQDTQFRGGTIGGEPTYSAGDRVLVRFQEDALAASGRQA